MTNKQMAKIIKSTAKAIRKAYKQECPEGEPIITIEWGLPYVSINLTANKNYFFQEQEASDLLAEGCNMVNKYNVNLEDCLLYQADSWG